VKMSEVILPNGWAMATVGDLADYVNGRAFKPTEWKDAGKPIIRIQNLNRYDAKYNFSPENHEEKYLVRNGDLLFAWSASLGAYIWHGGDAWLNQHIFVVHPKKCTTKLFIFYLLEKITAELYAKAHGSGMIHVTKGKFESTEIPLPPLNEQRRIVAKIEELFSELDKGIENLKNARAQLKVYRQALLKHAFDGKLTVQWRAERAVIPAKAGIHSNKKLGSRLRGNDDMGLETADALYKRIQQERAQRYQQQLSHWQAGSKPKAPKPLPPLTAEELAELPELPEGWLGARLGWMTCSVEYGTSAKSSESGACPVLRMGNIQNGKFDWADLVFTDDEDEIEKYLLQEGDVLFNRTNSPELVGKSAIFKSKQPAIFAGYLIRVNQIAAIVESQYLNYFLNSHIAKQHGNTVKTDGVNQSNINGEKLVNYPFPFCSLEEQKVIVELLDARLSEVDQLELTITTSLQQAEALRQSILKKAFSGQLVAQDANDEPAFVLLERIKVEREVQLAMAKRRKLKKVQPQPAPVKTNVIPFPVKLANISTTDLHAGILARAYQHHEYTPKYLAYFGHVKAEKIAHLIEAHLGIDLGREPVKAAVGPNDYPHLKRVEFRAQKANWFEVRKKKGSEAYVFNKKHGFETLLGKTVRALGERAAEVDELMRLLLPLNTRQAEIVATLYAAWNNLLLVGCTPSDEDIVCEARENWHDSKLKIERDKFFRGLKWMHEQGLVPAGKGRHVGKKK